MEPVYVL